MEAEHARVTPEASGNSNLDPRADAPAMDPRHARFVRSLRRSERGSIALGCVLVVLGGGYAGWALARFDPRAEIAQHMSFDRPVSALGRVFDPYNVLLRVVKPKTELESTLLRTLQRSNDFSVGIMITLLRVFLGTLALVMGMVALTVVVERRRLLRVIDTLAPPT